MIFLYSSSIWVFREKHFY
ncbi:rCG52792 [Rattus norvegicus]|uniref:RCG52792 n=1 Tax=Rattus norvegicus TaxID=10116 RepID=A6IRJ7_RAT|nr:rCG52792 [Rattus norvegicus]